jgi:hypothetical protein
VASTSCQAQCRLSCASGVEFRAASIPACHFGSVELNKPEGIIKLVIELSPILAVAQATLKTTFAQSFRGIFPAPGPVI